jgi:hypothetical protein
VTLISRSVLTPAFAGGCGTSGAAMLVEVEEVDAMEGVDEGATQAVEAEPTGEAEVKQAEAEPMGEAEVKQAEAEPMGEAEVKQAEEEPMGDAEEVKQAEDEEDEVPAVPICKACDTKDTPQWRRGPLGANTLCDACGVEYLQTGEYSNSSFHPKSDKTGDKTVKETPMWWPPLPKTKMPIDQPYYISNRR